MGLQNRLRYLAGADYNGLLAAELQVHEGTVELGKLPQCAVGVLPELMEVADEGQPRRAWWKLVFLPLVLLCGIPT